MRHSTLVFALLFSAAAFAQAPAAPPVSDAGVGRISLLRGDVSTQRGDSGDWIAAAINAPVVTSDKIATAAGARAELQLDFGDTLRLGENAQAILANLSNSQIQVQLGHGVADYAVLPGAEAAAEIDTPNIAIHPRGRGEYRIQVNSDNETVVIVRDGDADITTPQGSAELHRGQQITVQGTDDPQYQIADAPPLDEWDSFNQQRDRATQDARSWSNTNPYYTGTADLDTYGHWEYVPGYGQVWSPNAGPDWVPYSAGRWTWEPYYGWTWVSAEPWGWAPYHYGRWFFYGASWVWWPGPVAPRYRPIWAPAYVSFVGFGGGGIGVGVGFGSIGWVPIGPGDPFRPWYGGAVVTRVDVLAVNGRVGIGVIAPLAPIGSDRVVVYSNLDHMATDPHIAHAVVTVQANNFGRGAVVRENATMAQIRGGQVMGGTLPIVPTRESLRVSDRAVNVAALPRAAVAPAHFYGARPAVAPPPRFDEQAAAVQRTVAAGPGARPDPILAGRVSGPAAARPAAPAPAARAGWSSFGSRGAGSSTPANTARQPEQPPAAGGTPPAPNAANEARGSTMAPKPAENAAPAKGWQKFTPPPAKDKKPPAPLKKDGGGGGPR